MLRTGLRLTVFNLDEYRWAVERMDPAAYLAASYYEKRLAALERLYIEKGVITHEELDRRQKQPLPRAPFQQNPTNAKRIVTPAESSSGQTVAFPPRYKSGDPVRAKNFHPRGHTRLPRYARGKPGIIQQVLGAYLLPDKNAMGLGAHLEYVYSVCFEARDLWGADAPANDRVFLDLWESYLERGR